MENKNRKIVFDVIHTYDDYPVYWLYFKDQYGHGIDPDDLFSCEYSMKREMEMYIRDGYDFENHIDDFEDWLDELLDEIKEEKLKDMIEDMVVDFEDMIDEYTILVRDVPFLKKLTKDSDLPDCPRLLMETILNKPIQGVNKWDVEKWIFTKNEAMGSGNFNTWLEELYSIN
tara:strand:+ start:1441 stop:1956 length:516 start_codon:yes stop_codon:yes gene_type:complete